MKLPNSPFRVVRAGSEYDCEECPIAITRGELCISVWHQASSQELAFTYASRWWHFHPNCALAHYDKALERQEVKAIKDAAFGIFPQGVVK